MYAVADRIAQEKLEAEEKEQSRLAAIAKAKLDAENAAKAAALKKKQEDEMLAKWNSMMAQKAETERLEREAAQKEAIRKEAEVKRIAAEKAAAEKHTKEVLDA